MDYAVNDGEQQGGGHCPEAYPVVAPGGLKKEREKDDEADHEEHLSGNHHQLYVGRLCKQSGRRKCRNVDAVQPGIQEDIPPGPESETYGHADFEIVGEGERTDIAERHCREYYSEDET